jgi:hypothetical protein
VVVVVVILHLLAPISSKLASAIRVCFRIRSSMLHNVACRIMSHPEKLICMLNSILLSALSLYQGKFDIGNRLKIRNFKVSLRPTTLYVICMAALLLANRRA